MDFVMGLPQTRRQNDCIWVDVDRFKKFSNFFLVKSTYPAEDYARFFINEIVFLHGIPL